MNGESIKRKFYPSSLSGPALAELGGARWTDERVSEWLALRSYEAMTKIEFISALYVEAERRADGHRRLRGEDQEMPKIGELTVGKSQKLPKLHPRVAAWEGRQDERTMRLVVFQLLDGEIMSEAQLGEFFSQKTIPHILKDEGVCDMPRIRRVKVEGQRAAGFTLTRLGRKHLKEGKVDSHAAPSSAGRSWPIGR